MPRTKVFVKGEHQQESVAVLALAEGTLISLRIPADLSFDMTHFSNEADVATAFGNIIWRVRRNGVPQKPIQRQLDRLGDLTNPISLGKPIQFSPGDLLEVTAENTHASTTFTPAALIKGEYFKVEDA